MKCTTPKCSSVVFILFTGLPNSSHQLFPHHFHCPQSYLIAIPFPSSPVQNTKLPFLCFCFYFRYVFVGKSWGGGEDVRDQKQLGGVCSLPSLWDLDIKLQLLLMSHLDCSNLCKWIFLFGEFYNFINAALHMAFYVFLVLVSIFLSCFDSLSM